MARKRGGGSDPNAIIGILLGIVLIIIYMKATGH